MEKVRLAVFGLGRIANSGHLPAITACKDVIDLIAVVDPIEEKAKAAYEKYSPKKMYLSQEEALADPEIEAVALCLPHFLHAPVAVAACKAGKHVLVEKPMAINTADADEMIAAADAAGVTLMIGQSRRFHLAILECKKRFAEIGKPLQLITNWMGFLPGAQTEWWRSVDKAGGLLIPLQGSHAVDFILWMLEKTPTTVYAQSAHNNDEWEGEDEAVIQMGFDDGTIGTILLSFNAKGMPYERFIVGSKGVIYTAGETLLKINDQEIINGEEPNSSFQRQYREYVAAIREGREPLASGKEVRKVIVTLDAVHRSIREGSVVRI